MSHLQTDAHVKFVPLSKCFSLFKSVSFCSFLLTPRWSVLTSALSYRLSLFGFCSTLCYLELFDFYNPHNTQCLVKTKLTKIQLLKRQVVWVHSLEKTVKSQKYRDKTKNLSTDRLCNKVMFCFFLFCFSHPGPKKESKRQTSQCHWWKSKNSGRCVLSHWESLKERQMGAQE